MRIALEVNHDGVHGTLVIDDTEVEVILKRLDSEVMVDNYEITTMGMHGRQFTRGPEQHEITIRLLVAGKAKEATNNIRLFNNGNRRVEL